MKNGKTKVSLASLKVMADAVKAYKEGHTVVIDAKITKDRPIPVETLKLDSALYSAEEIQAYK